MMMESSNDWDLQAVVRSCSSTAACSSSSSAAVHKEAPAVVVEAAGAEFLRQQAAATSLRGLDYLNLDHELPFSITPASDELLLSFPAAGQSTRKQLGRRKPGVRAPRPKRSKKSQLKKVVCEVPVADGGVSTDLWAWRKYGQKPIKGSPYPRGYYKCSSLKACVARKLVERNPEKADVLIVTYIGDHCHAVPTMVNSLAGTTRNRPEAASPDDRHSHQLSSDDASSSMTVDGGGGAEDALWPLDMSLLDEFPLDDFLVEPPFDDDVDLSLEDDEEHDGGLGRRMSL